jgi:putative DNA primase/helicase
MSLPFSPVPASSLERSAREICEKLGGYWSRTRGMACCPGHDDRTPSLGVTLGHSAILFHCFAGCSQEQVLDGLARQGIKANALFAGGQPFSGEGVDKEGPRGNFAERIWREARPIGMSHAKAYLEARGIRAASAALRYHERTPLGPKGQVQFLPAMIAAVTLDHGLVAIHRTFLERELPRLASFTNPKRALGRMGAGAVRLFDPVDGKLGLAEGIESAISAKALTRIPCWATLGNERFGIVSIPDSVRELHLFIDNDAGGGVAEERAREAYAVDGRRILIRRPERSGADWNDVLVARQKVPG